MTLSINISEKAEEMLRGVYGQDLGRAAIEAMTVEGYRSGKLSRFEVQTLLGFDNRWDTEEWLGARGLNLHYSLNDLEADRQTLDRLLGPVKP